MATMTRPHAAMTAYGMAAQTSSPVERILMLYDGAIRRVEEGRRAAIDQRIEDRYNALNKASTILIALQSALDHERGGTIARQLDQLYTYLDFRLSQANIRNDTEILDEVAARLRELRASWAQLANRDLPPSTESSPRSSVAGA